MGHETAVECRPEEMQRQADPPFSLVLFPALSPAQVKLIVAGVISGLSELLREHPKALACTNTEHLRQVYGSLCPQAHYWQAHYWRCVRFMLPWLNMHSCSRVCQGRVTAAQYSAYVGQTEHACLVHAAVDHCAVCLNSTGSRPENVDDGG